MTNRRKLLNDGGGNIPGKEEAVAGDILCAKEDGSKMVYKAADYVNISSDWTPIGIVVVPPSHDVYGTGEGAAVSLNYMDNGEPDEGSTSAKGMYWGQFEVDTELTNFYTVNNTDNSPTPTILIGSYGYLPSDMFTSHQCILDPVVYYKKTYDQVPSPYLSDGSRYEGYYTTEYSEYNCLSDFDGVSNTKVLCNLATYESWKTGSYIINNYDSGYSPAACCCWRYHTTGTNQGDWYLPAMGELGYMVVRLKAIITSIHNIWSTSVEIGDTYWSSSEISNAGAYSVDMYHGSLGYSSKGSPVCVKSFIRF